MKFLLNDSLHLLASTPNAIIHSIGHPTAGTPDPILYFYEHFLAAYDKVERIRKGVYYTPRPLVDYLVRAADDILRASFDKPLGLADKDVRLLDPALGTGTFVLAAAQKAADQAEAALGSGAVKGVLEDRRAPRRALTVSGCQLWLSNPIRMDRGIERMGGSCGESR